MIFSSVKSLILSLSIIDLFGVYIQTYSTILRLRSAQVIRLLRLYSVQVRLALVKWGLYTTPQSFCDKLVYTYRSPDLIGAEGYRQQRITLFQFFNFSFRKFKVFSSYHFSSRLLFQFQSGIFSNPSAFFRWNFIFLKSFGSLAFGNLSG